jgi:hypothetical protein
MPSTQELVLDLQFESFDVNEAAENWDMDSQKDWQVFNSFLVADATEYEEAMQGHFDFYGTTEDEFTAFSSGVEYAVAKMNSALQAAGSDLIIKYCDLVDGGGFILSNQGMSERAWAKAAFSKKARKFG